jgi:hypothetical protein
MLETYRFVGMVDTMHPPTQWVPEDPSREKWSRSLSYEYILPRRYLESVAIHAHLHTPSHFTCLLRKKIMLHALQRLQLQYFTT